MKSDNLNKELRLVTAELHQSFLRVEEDFTSLELEEIRRSEVTSMFDEEIQDCRSDIVLDALVDCEDTWRELALIDTPKDFDDFNFKEVRALAFAAYEYKRDLDSRVLNHVEKIVGSNQQ